MNKQPKVMHNSKVQLTQIISPFSVCLCRSQNQVKDYLHLSSLHVLTSQQSQAGITLWYITRYKARPKSKYLSRYPSLVHLSVWHHCSLHLAGRTLHELPTSRLEMHFFDSILCFCVLIWGLSSEILTVVCNKFWSIIFPFFLFIFLILFYCYLSLDSCIWILNLFSGNIGLNALFLKERILYK